MKKDITILFLGIFFGFLGYHVIFVDKATDDLKKENSAITNLIEKANHNEAENIIAKKEFRDDSIAAKERNTVPQVAIEGAQRKRNLNDLKGKFLAAQGANNLNEELKLLNEMKYVDSGSEEYMSSMGRHLVRQRDWGKAEEALNQCLSAFPSSKSCNVDMASTALQNGNLDEQKQAMESCLKHHPSDPQCLNMYAIYNMNSGSPEKSISIYKSLMEKNGSYGFRFGEGHLDWQLGLAYERNGGVAEAGFHYEKACSANFDHACERLEKL